MKISQMTPLDMLSDGSVWSPVAKRKVPIRETSATPIPASKKGKKDQVILKDDIGEESD
jgi:hypothetical protein